MLILMYYLSTTAFVGLFLAVVENIFYTYINLDRSHWYIECRVANM